jgi:hypothetical protein
MRPRAGDLVTRATEIFTKLIVSLRARGPGHRLDGDGKNRLPRKVQRRRVQGVRHTGAPLAWPAFAERVRSICGTLDRWCRARRISV